jgi:hypothetical protein
VADATSEQSLNSDPVSESLEHSELGPGKGWNIVSHFNISRSHRLATALESWTKSQRLKQQAREKDLPLGALHTPTGSGLGSFWSTGERTCGITGIS